MRPGDKRTDRKPRKKGKVGGRTGESEIDAWRLGLLLDTLWSVFLPAGAKGTTDWLPAAKLHFRCNPDLDLNLPIRNCVEVVKSPNSVGASVAWMITSPSSSTPEFDKNGEGGRGGGGRRGGGVSFSAFAFLC